MRKRNISSRISLLSSLIHDWPPNVDNQQSAWPTAWLTELISTQRPFSSSSSSVLIMADRGMEKDNQPSDWLTDQLAEHTTQSAATQHLSSSSLLHVRLTNDWYSWQSTNRLPDTSRRCRCCHFHTWTEPRQRQRHTRLCWLPGWYCRKPGVREGYVVGQDDWLSVDGGDLWLSGWRGPPVAGWLWRVTGWLDRWEELCGLWMKTWNLVDVWEGTLKGCLRESVLKWLSTESNTGTFKWLTVWDVSECTSLYSHMADNGFLNGSLVGRGRLLNDYMAGKVVEKGLWLYG